MIVVELMAAIQVLQFVSNVSFFNKSTGSSQFIDSNVATLTYTYNENLKMDEKYRLKKSSWFPSIVL